MPPDSHTFFFKKFKKCWFCWLLLHYSLSIHACPHLGLFHPACFGFHFSPPDLKVEAEVPGLRSSISVRVCPFAVRCLWHSSDPGLKGLGHQPFFSGTGNGVAMVSVPYAGVFEGHGGLSEDVWLSLLLFCLIKCARLTFSSSFCNNRLLLWCVNISYLWSVF